jgi:hypothetical protein
LPDRVASFKKGGTVPGKYRYLTGFDIDNGAAYTFGKAACIAASFVGDPGSRNGGLGGAAMDPLWTGCSGLSGERGTTGTIFTEEGELHEH